MKPLIVANWKMNPSNSKDAFDLAKTVTLGVKDLNVDVVLCPPFLYVPQLLPVSNVAIGAQDCFWEEEGAYTGEISARMLKNMGCGYVILGHSERKKYLGETMEMVNKKVIAALKAQLIPIVCIGEDVSKELSKVLKGVEKEDLKHLMLVYEPEWAISASKNAKPETSKHAKEIIENMRNIAGRDVVILYGGSVDSKNVRSFIEDAGVQGVLVGASSLNAEEFIKLAQGAAR